MKLTVFSNPICESRIVEYQIRTVRCQMRIANALRSVRQSDDQSGRLTKVAFFSFHLSVR